MHPPRQDLSILGSSSIHVPKMAPDDSYPEGLGLGASVDGVGRKANQDKKAKAMVTKQNQSRIPTTVFNN